MPTSRIVPLSLALALAGTGAACKSKEEVRRSPAPARDAGTAAGDVDPALFPTARPQVEHAEVPARFSARLPASEAEVAAAPPDPYVDAALASDAHGMRAKLVEAIVRAAAAPMSEELRAYYEHRLTAAIPAACDWIASVATGGAGARNASSGAASNPGSGPSPAALPAAVRDVFWGALARCIGPAVDAAFATDAAPDAAVIDYWFEGYEARGPFRPRVARAAATVARSEDPYQARKIGFAFAAMEGPEVIPAMLALQRSIPDPERRALVALGLLRHPDPEARKLGEAACRHPEVRHDAMCDRDDEDALATAARDEGVDIDAGTDDRAADAVAADLSRELAQHGFTAAPGAMASPEPPATLEDALAAMGRLASFDTETGQWPNEHDRLLAELAATCAPALAGVVFEERAPRDHESEDPYTLVAYDRGRAYRVRAQNLGDWYDVEAAVGLVNALLAARGSELGLAVLATSDQITHTVCGPRAGITALVRRGRLAVGSADAAEGIGKDFEERVLRELERKGMP